MNRQPTWVLTVAEYRSVQTAMIVLQPADQNIYDAALARFRRAGWQRVTQPEYDQAMWSPVSSGYVDVVQQHLIRVTAGPSSFYTGQIIPISDRWRDAAVARRVAVALVPIRTFSADEPDGPTVPGRLGVLRDLALNQRLYIGLAQARFGEMPTTSTRR